MAASALHLSYKSTISGTGSKDGSNTDYSPFTNTFTVSGNIIFLLTLLLQYVRTKIESL
jgi:hypothetical protein